MQTLNELRTHDYTSLFDAVSGYFTCLLAFSFLYDYMYTHPMCELCVLARIWMFVIVAVALSARWLHTWSTFFVVVISVMLWTGLMASLWHFQLYQSQLMQSACGYMSGPSYLHKSIYDMLSQYYRFAPCEAAVYTFLGWTFMWWNILSYVAILVLYNLYLLRRG